MKSEFSEFSYGYAVTEELVTSCRASVVGAPIFPSLYEEGTEGGGYDLKLPRRGTPIFLQFKVSHYLARTSAKENIDGLLAVPYYRMYLHALRHSHQHRMLLALQASGEQVLYICPEFRQVSELNEYYLQHSVITRSAAFAPEDIGPLADDGEHYIAFRAGGVQGLLRSESRIPVRRWPLNDGFLALFKSRDVRSRPTDEGSLGALRDRLISIIADEHIEPVGRVAEIAERRSPAETIGYLARMFFGAEVLIVSDDTKATNAPE